MEFEYLVSRRSNSIRTIMQLRIFSKNWNDSVFVCVASNLSILTIVAIQVNHILIGARVALFTKFFFRFQVNSFLYC